MSDNKVSIRPKIIGLSVENTTTEETFQQLTLRPIIKLQHDLVVAFFDNHLLENKINFKTLNAIEKSALIDRIFKTNTRFKTELRGLIIGLFTVEEYQLYQTMAKDINKRITTIVKERLLSTIP